MQQVRGGVIPHRGLADVAVDDGVDFLADANRLLGDDLMRAHALNGGIATGHFGDDSVVIVGIEPAAVADLSAGLGIERRVVEDDLALVARLQFLRALAILDDREDLAVFGASLTVALEGGFWKLLIRRIRGLLGGPFPRGAGAVTFVFQRSFEWRRR